MNGFVFNSADRVESGVPIVRIENLNGSRDFNYSGVSMPSRYRVDQGDLLFAWSGNPGTSFGPYLWKEPGSYYLNQHIFKVDVFGCDRRWLYWSLRAATRWIETDLVSGMIGMVHVTKEDLAGVPIPLPPPEEQRHIADFLDAETARIDNLVARYRKLIALLGERVDAASEEVIAGNSSKYVRLKFLLRRPLSYGANAAAEHVNQEWPRYIRTTDIAEDGSLRGDTFASLPYDQARRYLLEEGDILFVRSGATVGKSFLYRDHFGPAAHAGYLIRASVDYAIYNPDLLYIFCQTSRYWSQVLGGSIQATIQNVSAEKYAGVRVPWIDRSRQDGIVREIQEVAQAVAALKRRAASSVDLLIERRQALITAAVTGEFDVSAASGRGIEE